MDFRERLLKNEIRFVSDNLKALADEFMAIRGFLEQTFESQLKEYLSRLGKSGTDAEGPSSSYSHGSNRSHQFPGDDNHIQIRGTGFSLNKFASRKRRSGRIKNARTIGRPSQPQYEEPREDFMLPTNVVVDEGNGACEAEHEGNNMVAAVGFNLEEGEESEIIDQQTFSVEVKKEIEEVDDIEGITDDDEASFTSGSDQDPDFNMSNYVLEGYQGKRKRRRPKPGAAATSSPTKSIRRGPSETSRYQKCYICFKDVGSRPLVVAHLQEFHTREEAEQRFICITCGHRTNDVESFDKHQLFHTNIDTAAGNPCICRFCGHLSRDVYKKVEHERSHTGERPHVCTVCPKAFARIDNLARHLRLHGIATAKSKARSLKCEERDAEKYIKPQVFDSGQSQ